MTATQKRIALNALALVIAAALWWATRMNRAQEGGLATFDNGATMGAAPGSSPLPANTPDALAVVSPPPHAVAAKAEVATAEATTPTAATPSPTQDSAPPLKSPSLADYRKEVEKDPESPPPSLLAFAAELGPRMQEAMKSEDAAKNLMPELENCTLARAGHDPVASAQAVCLSAAHKLGRQYPGDLGDRVAKLTEQSDPRVKQILTILPKSEQ